MNWKINGGHAQAITTQPENYIDDREARGKTILEATSLYLPIVNLKAGNGYYFKIFDNNNKIQNDSRYLAVDFYDENKVKIGSRPLGLPVDFTEEMATKVKYAKIYYNGNDTDKVIGNTVIKKIGLKITSNVSADDIDMFVPNSPSPDYPSEVETVGSNVNLLENKAISQTINGVTFTVNKDGSIMANGIATTNTTFKINNDIVPKNISNLILSGCPNNGSKNTYDLKIELYTNLVWQKAIYDYGEGINLGDLSEYTSGSISITIRKDYNANNLIFKPKLEKGSVATPYSPYGMGSVEIDVVNSNLLDFNVVQDSRVTINKDGTITIDGNGGFVLYFKQIKFEANMKYYIRWEIISGTVTGSNIFQLNDTWIGKNTFTKFFRSEDKKIRVMWIHANAVFTNAKIKMWISKTQSNFEPHQSQTAIMPVQQEMLEGDYISDVEHHEWTKIVLDGTENWREITTNNLKRFFYEVSVASINDNNSVNCISNYFKGTSRNKLESSSGDEISVADKFLNILSKKIETKEDFKAWLKSKYDEGNPVIVYYKLVTPLNLELTPEQKAVRKTKLYTYKNITNISLSDELASIDVNYKKDLETMFNNIIKQIPSSTNDTAET